MGMCMRFLWHVLKRGCKAHFPLVYLSVSILLLRPLCLTPIYNSDTRLHHRTSPPWNVSPLFFPLSGLLAWQAVRGFSLTASALLLFSSWTWCIAVFTRPAWLINSPLQGLFINCLCLFYNEYAIFRAGHFHNTCIFFSRASFVLLCWGI